MAESNILREVKIGNTRIKIAGDYCEKTEIEVEEILQRIAKQAQRNMTATAIAS